MFFQNAIRIAIDKIRVRALASNQGVDTCPAIERVCSIGSEQRVVSTAAKERVIALASVESVISGISGNAIIIPVAASGKIGQTKHFDLLDICKIEAKIDIVKPAGLLEAEYDFICGSAIEVFYSLVGYIVDIIDIISNSSEHGVGSASAIKRIRPIPPEKHIAGGIPIEHSC